MRILAALATITKALPLADIIIQDDRMTLRRSLAPYRQDIRRWLIYWTTYSVFFGIGGYVIFCVLNIAEYANKGGHSGAAFPPVSIIVASAWQVSLQGIVLSTALLLVSLPRVLELNNVDVFVLDREKKTLQRNGCEIGTLTKARDLQMQTRMGVGGKRQFQLTLAPEYGPGVILAETSAIPDQEEANRYFFARSSFFGSGPQQVVGTSTE